MNRVKAPKTSRQRANERGWVFRPVNPMPELILRAAYAHRNERFKTCQERLLKRPFRGQPSRPGMPMPDGERIMAYYRQNGTPRRPLTPRQQRRRKHKDTSLRVL